MFCCRSSELAGPLVMAFVEYHRFTAVSYKLPLLGALVGLAALAAEANGVAGAGHVKDKLTQLVIYAETVRALTEVAAMRAAVDGRGIAVPDPLTTNLAKYTFATGYHRALELVQDCGRPARHRPRRGRLGEPRGAPGAREVLPRRSAGRGAATAPSTRSAT